MTRALIVLATHNPNMALLERQLASITAQTVTDWECLVFDDASVAPVRAELEGLLAADPRFRLLRAQQHLGHYRAFEHLLAAADRDVPVFLCDQDDRWSPAKMQVMLAELDRSAAAVFSAMRVVDESGAPIRERFLPRAPDSMSLQPAELLLMNCVSGAALAISGPTLRASLPFPAPEYRGWHDQWLAAVAARTGTLSYLEEPLTDYTQHAAQVMGDGLRSVNPRRLRGFVERARTPPGLQADLRSRTRWIAEAAEQLLLLSDRADPDLESLARGRWSKAMVEQLWRGVRRRDVPVSRAALLAAGLTLG